MTAAGEWVQDRLNWHADRLAKRRRNPIVRTAPVLSDFQHDAIRMFVQAMGTGIYNLPVNWTRGDYSYAGAVHLVMYGTLASWDFNHLTRLVIAAHDSCVRVSIEAAAPKYVRIAMHRRDRTADAIHARHPTIEQAVEAYRKSVSPQDPETASASK